MATVANDFLILARHLASSNKYADALNMYLCAFSKDLECKKALVGEFRAVLTKMNADLAAVKNKSAIFANFSKALEVFPDNVDLFIDIGNYLYRYGYMFEAMCHFEKVLTMDSSYISAEKILNNTKTFLFPRSQYKILNDRIRNSAYREAIRSCVTHVDSVIDIDAGTGLLALYASECNPVAVTACESSTAMAQLAETMMQDNHAQDVIVLNKPSVVLEYTDIYFRKSVLLTDAFDSGLFGEYILQALCHAWENLLAWDSITIPSKAEYFIVGVKCDELYKKYKLSQNMKDILNVSNMNVHPTTSFGDTYCSEHVHLYNNVKYMCEPKSLFTIDFNRYLDVYDMLHRQDPYEVELTATEDGEINVVIGWFNLYLTESITLTSDPRSLDRTTGYQQAIFFDVPSKKVRRNETTSISFLTDGRLTTVPDVNVQITRISRESIAYLNDTEFTDVVIKSVSVVCIHLGQTVALGQVDILDLSPFPLFGVLMMRRGANSLVCHAKTVDDKAFLETVLVANGICTSKVTILVSEYVPFDEIKNEMFHVIFSQFLNLNGDINVRQHWMFENLKRNNLVSGGVCLPVSVVVMAQLVASDYLEMNNRVQDDNVNCRMAPHVNRYRVSETLNLDMTQLEYEALSDVFEVASCEELNSDVVAVPIIKDGDCNAILCWYKIKLLEDWDVIYTNRSNSLVECMAFVITPHATKVFRGDEVSILRCVDPVDSSYKLALHVE